MKNPRSTFIAALVALSVAGAASGQSAGKPPEQLGKVSFANSCAPAAQATFERAVALLHSFWWQEGEKTFREALERDPGCAIATWGIATILIGNRFGARPHGARIKSLSDAFEVMAKRFPDDDEAQIFSAIYLTATQSPAEKTFASALKAAAILEDQFKKHPDHPGVAHYLIHSYDYPPIAGKGLTAAKRYSEIAPSAPHALHMPSHIFTRVGAWQDSARMNERSAAVAKAEKDFGGQLHAMDYLAYAYLQLGRDADARRVLEEAQSVRSASPAQGTPYALAAIPARYAVERGAWKEAARLEPQENRFRFTMAFTHFARALGAARSGDPAAAERDVL